MIKMHFEQMYCTSIEILDVSLGIFFLVNLEIYEVQSLGLIIDHRHNLIILAKFSNSLTHNLLSDVYQFVCKDVNSGLVLAFMFDGQYFSCVRLFL